MGKYDEVIANLSQVDDDTLNSTHAEAKARLSELRPKIAERTLSADELAEVRELSPQFKQLHDAVKDRAAQREAAYGSADELSALLDEDTAGVRHPEGDPDEEGEKAPNIDPVQDPLRKDPVEQPSAPQDDPAEDRELIAASAAPKTPKLGEVAKNAPKAPVGKPPMVITAAADVQGFHAGQELQVNQIGKALESRLRAVANSGANGNGEQVVVASINAQGVPEERVLRANDSVERNTNKITRVTSQQAITAAGGLCAPLAIDYNYGVWGVQGRPIRDSLPGFQVERGGVQFRPDLSPMLNTSGSGPKGATGFWTMADDAAVADGTDTTTRKAYWIVDCPSTQTASIEAITLQIEFANITSRFDPETLQANTEAALVWHDRVAENHLLAQLQAASKYMTSAAVLGATRDLLVTFDKVQAYYRSVHRLGDNIRLRAILPFWAKNMIRSDIARQMNDDGLSTLNITDAQINAFFDTRNITPVWHLDGNSAAVSASGSGGTAVPAIAAQQYSATSGTAAVPNYPAQVDMLLHPEGHFQHLDGGTLDLGIVRDADLVRRNRYRQFSESFEGVAARGVEALRLVATVVPNGGMSGTVAPSSVTA